MNLVNTTYNSTEKMINQLQQSKGKIKLNFYENISNCYDNMNIRFDQDLFAENVQGISKVYHEMLVLMKFLQTKPQVKNMNFSYYDLYYTVIKSREEKKIIDNKYENDYISFNDIVPNHFIGRKKDNVMLR